MVSVGLLRVVIEEVLREEHGGVCRSAATPASGQESSHAAHLSFTSAESPCIRMGTTVWSKYARIGSACRNCEQVRPVGHRAHLEVNIALEANCCGLGVCLAITRLQGSDAGAGASTCSGFSYPARMSGASKLLAMVSISGHFN